MDKLEQRLVRDELGFPCKHEYRQLMFHPKYISRDFNVMFYCIYCTGVTTEKGVNELQQLAATTK